MINLWLAYGFAFLLGALAVRLCLNPGTKMSPWHYFLAPGLGLGLASQITFYSFLIVGKLHAPTLITMNLLLITALLFLYIRRDRSFKIIHLPPTSLIKKSFMGVALFILLHALYSQFAQCHPFGEWDAWAVWNVKTKFLIFGGERWANLFQLHWHTQPSYPLLLPMLQAWLWTAAPHDFYLITSSVGIIFAISTVGMLWAVLKERTSFWPALVAALLLLTHFNFVFLATSQYADAVLGYYLLAGLIVLTNQDKLAPRSGMLLGLITGLIAFSKNEGLALAAILIVLGLCRKGPATSRKNHAALLLAGFFIAATPVLIEKFFLAEPNRDFTLARLTATANLFNGQGIHEILHYTRLFFFDPGINYFWFFLLGLCITGTRRYFVTEQKPLTIFFIAYGLMVLLVYLTTAHYDLAWRLLRTGFRILYYLLPSLLFWHFGAWFAPPGRKD